MIRNDVLCEVFVLVSNDYICIKYLIIDIAATTFSKIELSCLFLSYVRGK